jgi:spore coat polysaccharide biosynthesis protein SpsF
MSKTIAIIQARTGSTRLPGKVLKPILGRPMLELMFERVKRAKSLDAIIVATTDKQADDPIAELADRCGTNVFRGSEEDVLDRCYRAAKEAIAEASTTIVCLTGDCPLHDPDVIDAAVKHFNDAKDVFAFSGTPGNYPEGLDTDIFAFSALEEAQANAKLHSEREHMAQYFFNHPERFHTLPWTAGVRNDSQMHWSVDTEKDFEFITKIFEHLYPVNSSFNKDDVLALLAQHPEFLEINKGGTGYEGLAKSLKIDEEMKEHDL